MKFKQIASAVLALSLLCGGVLPAGKWLSATDGVEEYERYVAAADGRILIMLMHHRLDPSAPWGVYQDGQGFGDYLTKEQARAAAEKRLSE